MMAGGEVNLPPVAAPLPGLDDLPIPRNVRVDDRWPSQLREIADHIGPYHALLLVERFGGQQVRVPINVARSPFRAVLPVDLADKVSFAFAGCELEVPVCRDALTHARRQPVIAAVRADKMTVRQAAIVLGTARSYVTQLVNRTGEGLGFEPLVLPEPRRLAALRNAAELAAIWLAETGATAADIEEARAGIIDLYYNPPEQGVQSEFTPD